MEIENLTNLAKLCTGFMIFLQQSWAVAVKTLFWLSNKRDLFYYSTKREFEKCWAFHYLQISFFMEQIIKYSIWVKKIERNNC